MPTQDKIRAIEQAIAQAVAHSSNLTPDALSVPGFTSPNIRHLMNNLGALSTRYLEIGVHKGGSFCSTIYGNPNLSHVTAIDHWIDLYGGKDYDLPTFKEFMCHAADHVDPGTNLSITRSPLFDVNPGKIVGPIDLYYYDADHSQQYQCDQIPYFLPCLDQEFVMCVDDFSWDQVRMGTIQGLGKANLHIVKDWEFTVSKPGQHWEQMAGEPWWNGFYVALLRKQDG